MVKCIGLTSHIQHHKPHLCKQVTLTIFRQEKVSQETIYIMTTVVGIILDLYHLTQQYTGNDIVYTKHVGTEGNNPKSMIIVF